MRTVNCPGCGAKLQLFSPLTRLVICSYCKSIVSIREDHVSVLGKQSGLAPAVSGLKVGHYGELDGKQFLVLGRVRYKYSDGHWDEWYVRYNDASENWLSEDEGEFSIEKRTEPTPKIPNLDGLGLGDKVQFGAWSGSVDEKDAAECSGLEGELPGEYAVGDKLSYAEGTGNDGKMFTVEQDDEGVQCFIGQWVPIRALKNTESPYSE